jgi:hypothetical protein
MTTGATGQLGLALPVQGELSGTWGDTVNNGLTEYTNIAIAATLTLTGDGAVTLANTTGDASATNITSSLSGAGTVTAQFAIVRITGTLTTAKVVTGPSYSKTYLVVNAATGGIVTFKASGQTGVSIAVGESAYVYYNGTDYVKASTTTAVTAVSVASANGFTGSSSGGTTPALTLATSITGLLKGNGTAISAATSGTDYAPATSGTSILYGNNTGGFSNVTIGTGITFSTGTLSATGSGGSVTTVGWTGGIVTVSNPTTTPAFTIAGTSGGIPYFNSGTTWATSAALAANALVIGGGAGTAPATTTTGTGVVTALGNNANAAAGFTTGSGTATLTNKRIDPRVTSAASASSLTPDISAADQYAYTALAAGLTINAPTGTPVDGDKLIFRLLDNGTARALTWNATYTVIGVTLPTTTTINKTVYIGCIYNANNTRWDVVAVTTQA